MAADRRLKSSLLPFAALIVIAAWSTVPLYAQAPAKNNVDKSSKAADGKRAETMRDLTFGATGVDLQFLIRELAGDLGLNVLFDSESFRSPRATKIALTNVTTSAALDYILLQEGLISEEVGPKTILVANRFRGTSIPQLGLGLTPLTEQLALYFRVRGGVLVNNVRPDSAGAKAGLQAGDVIVAVNGEPVNGGLGLIRAVGEKDQDDIRLKIVRDHREQTINLTSPRGTK